jgi:CheY-like chemotaxis protein
MTIRHLFLIENDQDDVDIFCMALSQVDPTVNCHIVRNGVEATEYLLSGKQLPDLIFLDVNMPVMNGMEFMKWRQQHAQLHQIPVYVYTTTNNPLTATVMNNLGAAKFITKPNKLEEVVRVIREVIAEFPPTRS